jgi:hypothetical protein
MNNWEKRVMKLFPLLYFSVFFLAAFVWPTYRVWMRTGINPYRLGSTDNAHDFIGRLFRLTLVAIVVIVAAGINIENRFLRPRFSIGETLI